MTISSPLAIKLKGFFYWDFFKKEGFLKDLSYNECIKLYYLFLDIKMTQEDFLVKIKKALCKYSNIPKDLYNYILDATMKDAQEHLLPAILK